jgi:hypothetical protein
MLCGKRTLSAKKERREREKERPKLRRFRLASHLDLEI